MESSVRTLFNPGVSSTQRRAATTFWGHLLSGVREIPQPNMDKIDPIRRESRQILTQMNPYWLGDFMGGLDNNIFDNRHASGFMLKSDSPGVLLQTANECKIPAVLIPRNVHMTFPNDNNSICVNNVCYSASEIINDKLGVMVKKPPQCTAVALSSKNIFTSLQAKKSAFLTAGLMVISTFLRKF